MKPYLLFLFVLIGPFLSAQTFTEAMDTPFDKVTSSSVAFADVDGDDDQDVLITGFTYVSTELTIAKLYANDGQGNFTEVADTPFEAVASGSVAFADFDGDDDQDVLITGINGTNTETTNLYLNDGQGNFTEVANHPFYVSAATIAVVDIDGDDDQDVLMIGDINPNAFGVIAKLYTNDGQGNFTEVANHPFKAASGAAIAIADIDGDNDQDVLITGLGLSPFAPIAKLYTNDGAGQFTEVANHPFLPNFGAVEFADVDGDNDPDVLMTGTADAPIGVMAKLYANDGLGNFTEVVNAPFFPLSGGAIAFADVDGDNDQDVLLTGFDTTEPTWVSTTKFYTNGGQGDFTEAVNEPFAGASGSPGSIAFSDVDGDSAPDVLITGFTGLDISPVTSLYINETSVSATNDLSGIDRLELALFPIPAKADQINIWFDSKEYGSVTIQVYDQNGRLLQQQQESAVAGRQAFSMDIASLEKGSYFIQLNDGKRKGVAKFMVQ